MYRTCLFCSASLGTNEAIESFPVGARVAVDARNGRLWAVCGRCGRWNLAPIEERWEAVEEAERLFVDTRTRVHSESIGLARLPDGTRLIRVGPALPGELAAWRYGRQLISRRNRNLAVTGALVAGGAALVAGLPLIATAGLPIGIVNVLQFGNLLRVEAERRRIVHRVPSAAPAGTGGAPQVVVRRWHLEHAVLGSTSDGDLTLDLPPLIMQAEWKGRSAARESGRAPDAPLRIAGEAARTVIARSMMDFNRAGATSADVETALNAIERAGGAEEFTRRTAGEGAAIVRLSRIGGARGARYSLRQIAGTFRGEILPVVKYRDPFFAEPRPQLSRTAALALEMALQEDVERRALEGELAALEAAWREAEEIARIADALPGDPRADSHQQHE